MVDHNPLGNHNQVFKVGHKLPALSKQILVCFRISWEMLSSLVYLPICLHVHKCHFGAHLQHIFSGILKEVHTSPLWWVLITCYKKHLQWKGVCKVVILFASHLKVIIRYIIEIFNITLSVLRENYQMALLLLIVRFERKISIPVRVSVIPTE